MGRLETPPPTALSASDGKTSLAFSTLTHCLRVNPRAAGSATHRLPPGRVALTRGVRRAAGGRGHSCSPALLALREPSRWMMMSAPFIIRRLWPDRMLPSRSGLGSVSTSGWGATAGAPLLQADRARPAVSPLQPWCPTCRQGPREKEQEPPPSSSHQRTAGRGGRRMRGPWPQLHRQAERKSNAAWLGRWTVSQERRLAPCPAPPCPTPHPCPCTPCPWPGTSCSSSSPTSQGEATRGLRVPCGRAPTRRGVHCSCGPGAHLHPIPSYPPGHTWRAPWRWVWLQAGGSAGLIGKEPFSWRSEGKQDLQTPLHCWGGTQAKGQVGLRVQARELPPTLHSERPSAGPVTQRRARACAGTSCQQPPRPPSREGWGQTRQGSTELFSFTT